MPKIPLPKDLKDVQRSPDSEVVPMDTYLVEIARAKEMPANEEKGTGPQILFALKVIDAQKPENAVYKGAEFIDVFSLKEKALWRIAQFQDAIYGRAVEGDSVDTDDLCGKRCVAQVSVEDSIDPKTNKKGAPRNRVDRYMNLSKWRKQTAFSGEKPADVPAATGGNGKPASAPQPTGKVPDGVDPNQEVDL